MKTLALLVLLLSLPRTGVAAAPAGPLVEAWQLLANFRPDLALPRFESLAAQDGADARAARLGAALSLLAQPSTVPDRVAKARVLLAGLAADGADDLGLAAQFYLARLAEFQAEPPDPVAAAAGFQRLIAEHPDSIWAQAAVPRLAILLLYTAAGPADPAARVAAAERLVATARQPRAVMELHLVIADAIFHHRLPDGRALPHLLAAERAGGMDAATRADVLTQIAELSRLGGDPAQAARYYRTFLAEYPRDTRQFPLRQRLAALEPAKPAP
jgi:hypothetical protein